MVVCVCVCIWLLGWICSRDESCWSCLERLVSFSPCPRPRPVCYVSHSRTWRKSNRNVTWRIRKTCNVFYQLFTLTVILTYSFDAFCSIPTLCVNHVTVVAVVGNLATLSLLLFLFVSCYCFVCCFIYYFNCISFVIWLSGRKIAIKLTDWLTDRPTDRLMPW